MSAFGGLKLTQKGIDLQAKAQIGTELQYTRICIGDGEYSGDVLDIESLVNQIMSLPVSSLSVNGGVARIGSAMSNQDLSVGFYMREIGVYATDPDDGEILYAYANAGEYAGYIPPAGGGDVVEKEVELLTTVGTAENVTAAIESSVFATVGYTDERINEVTAEMDEQEALSVSLTHGLNYVEAPRASALDMRFSGRTLQNILGTDGNCESLEPWTRTGIAEVSSDYVRSGMHSIKMSATGSDATFRKDYPYKLDTTKPYVFAGWVYIESWSAGAIRLALGDYESTTHKYHANADTSITGRWQFIYTKVPISNTIAGNGFRLYGLLSASPTSIAYFDSVRLYEVSEADYDAIGTTYTGEAVDSFIPYVDGTQHLSDVMVEKPVKNLLPPFTEWTLHPNATIVGPYKLQLIANAIGQQSKVKLRCLSSQPYTLSVQGDLPHGYRMRVYEDGVFKGAVSDLIPTFTWTTSIKAKEIEVWADNTVTGAFVYENPQLELGSAPTNFEMKETNYLQIPTKLVSSLDRNIADEVYFREGAWRKIKRWETDMVLDGTLEWSFLDGFSGYKRVSLVDFVPEYKAIPNSIALYGAKYDNRQLKSVTHNEQNATDQIAIGNVWLHMTIADSDSGWTDSLNPNVSAIKALMNGWRANANNGGVYTGWQSILDGSEPLSNIIDYVSTTKAPGWKGWATIDYLFLPSAVTEEIIEHTEGAIQLQKGGNQLELSPGSVWRESVLPVQSGGNWLVNKAASDSQLQHRAERIIAIYKNGKHTSWRPEATDAYGRQAAVILEYDPAAIYSVSYLKLDKYASTTNIVLAEGSFAETLGSVVAENVVHIADLQTKVDAHDRRYGDITDNLIANNQSDRHEATVVNSGELKYIHTNQTGPLDMRIKGRTLHNILGKYGDCESLNNWGFNGSVTTGEQLVSSHVKTGQHSIKFTTNNSSRHAYRDFKYQIDSSKRYILAAWVFIDSLTAGTPFVQLCDYGNTALARYTAGPNTSIIGEWQFIVRKVPAPNYFATPEGFRLVFGMSGAATAAVCFDSIRLYEVSQADYDAIGTTYVGEAIDTFIPYVDGIKHVSDAIVQCEGDNLFDVNTRISFANNVTFAPDGIGGFTLVATSSGTWRYVAMDIPVIPGQVYWMKANSTVSGGATGGGVTANIPTGGHVEGQHNVTNASFPFIAPQGGFVRLQFYVSSSSASAGSATFTDVHLTLGSQPPATYRPYSKTSLFLKSTLASNIEQTVSDELFYRNGSWRKLKRWETDFALDGSLGWSFSADGVGFKRVHFPLTELTREYVGNSQRVVKYNALPTTNRATVDIMDAADMVLLNLVASGNFHVTVADSESGWTEALNPNANAIKAFMNGWKANNNNGTTYTSWQSILDGSVPAQNTIAYVSANKALGWTGWGMLDYQLAQSSFTEEVIVDAEGAVALHEGGNQLHIDTGVVWREEVKPFLSNGVYYINNQNASAYVQHRAGQIIGVYKSGNIDPNWTRLANGTANGTGVATLPATKFDSNATYSVSYYKLDKHKYTANATKVECRYPATLGSAVREDVQLLTDVQTRVSAHDRSLHSLQQYLEDYEVEGSWVPTLVGSTTAGTHTYSAQTGYYVKTGKMVVATFNIALSAKGGTMSGSVSIGGLPFALRTGASYGASFTNYRNIQFTESGRTQLMGRGSGTSIALTMGGDNVTSTTSALAAGGIQNTTVLEGSIVYFTN